MVYTGDKPVGDWTDRPEVKKTCPVAFCLYPEQECEAEAINAGAVDALDFIYLQNMENCIMPTELPTDEEIDTYVSPGPVVSREYIDDDEGPDWVLQRYSCPVLYCNYTDIGLVSADGEMQHAFNEHWNDHHA